MDRTKLLFGGGVGILFIGVVVGVTQWQMHHGAATVQAAHVTGTSMPALTSFAGAMVDLGDSVLLLDATSGTNVARASRLTKESRTHQWTTELPWNGHDTKLVAQVGANIVIVDADGAAGVDRARGDLAWVR